MIEAAFLIDQIVCSLLQMEACLSWLASPLRTFRTTGKTVCISRQGRASHKS
jgi:hypothetical protein